MVNKNQISKLTEAAHEGVRGWAYICLGVYFRRTRGWGGVGVSICKSVKTLTVLHVCVCVCIRV